MRVTISLDEDVAAELQKSADQSGRSLKETVNESLRAFTCNPATPPSKPPLKALHLRPGIKLGSLGEMMELLDLLDQEEEGPSDK